MPITAAGSGLELPMALSRQGTGQTDFAVPVALSRQGTGQVDFADCLSPGATPKMNIPPSAANGPIPCWPQSSEAMPQIMYAPIGNAYNYPPETLMVVPFPCMMDGNGHFVQFPALMEQSQQASWAKPSNGFHMMQEVSSATINNSASHMDTLDLPLRMPPVSEDVSQNPDVPNAGMGMSDCIILPDDVVALGNPRQILQNAELAASVEDLLESASVEKRAAIITWMQPVVLALALSANGTRVVQKAIELTGGETQMRLSQCLHGYAGKLLHSHHGNHVLQACISMMPPHAVQFIFHELAFFPGGWAGVVRHRFGCRVVERLLEHCEPELTVPIVAAVAAEIDSLARHPFANYVIQHILEYVPAHSCQVVHALIQVGVPFLAQHRVASNIVERAFEHGGAKSQQALAEAILSTPNAITEMASSRYGSFTVRRMLEALQDPLRYMALQQLSADLSGLRASKYGRHIAARVTAALSNYGGAQA